MICQVLLRRDSKSSLVFEAFLAADLVDWQRTPVLNFIDNLESAPLLSLGASASYAVAEGTNIFLAGTAEKIFTARGDTDIYNNDTGVLLGTEFDGGGGDLFAASITGGIKGTF